MAVASDDLPRFSLLCGAGAAFARPQTPQIESELLACLSRDFTCECWLQIRTQRGQGAADGCWLLHTPSWSYGLTSDQRVIVYCNGLWKCTVSSAPRRLQARRWHHLTVSYRASARLCVIMIDGEVAATEDLGDPHGLQLPVSPTARVRVGWAPLAVAACQLVLHEFRIWGVALLDTSTVKEWMGKSVSHDHPAGASLVAHWSFSSGAVLSREYDLSGYDRDLEFEGLLSHCWLRITPHLFHPTDGEAVTRLTTLQDARSGNRSGCDFVIELEIQPASKDLSSSLAVFRNIALVLVLNFQCYRGPNLTPPGKGADVIKCLIEFVHQLPHYFQVALCCPSQKELTSELLPMTEDGKIRMSKILERSTVETVLQVNELIDAAVEAIDQSATIASAQELEISRRATAFMIVSETSVFSEGDDDSIINRVEKLQTKLQSVELHHICVNSIPSSTAPIKLRTPKISRLVMHYGSCEHDLEWILACIINRLRHIAVSSSQLKLEMIGGGNFTLSRRSNPAFSCSDSANARVYSVNLGVGAFGERTVLVGDAEFGSSDLSAIEVAFSCYTSVGRKHVARASIRPYQDLTAHTHIERALRNKQLRITVDQAQLLEQRRELMQMRKSFVGEFVSQEIAEAENSFKRVNIMKEELWARKKWIAARALRLFEEENIWQLEVEVETARSAFVERFESLQASFVANVRETGSRGASRGANNRRVAGRGVRVDDSAHVQPDEHEPERSEEQQLQKVNVKLNLLAKAFNEHELKMEDLFVSVRAAEAKGVVIMNDARRSWVDRYHDMLKVKQDIFRLTIEKERLELNVQASEDRLNTQQEIGAEAQFTNAAVARVEKELGKRRKRVALSVKEVFGCVVDEFESFQQLEAAMIDLYKARLLRQVAVTQVMYTSCIYLCFPVEISQEEVPTQLDLGIFVNVVHAMSVMLRNTCDSASKTPLCRRLSYGECFLWWGLEQLNQDDRAKPTNEERRLVRADSWAVMLVTFNSLFSSLLAWSDVKETLLSAHGKKKSVFHIQLEAPYAGLEEFRSQWAGRRSGLNDRGLSSVEREFLTWKQNYTSFQALMQSVKSVDEYHYFRPLLESCCKHEATSLDPCLKCIWPTISSSQQTALLPEFSRAASTQNDLVHLARRVGAWVDGANSELLQSAPRGFLVDPNSLTPLSHHFEKKTQDCVCQLRTKWEDMNNRRAKEIQRQVAKVFKVYDEEVNDLVTLQFKLFLRKEELQKKMTDKQTTMTDETNLIETWLERLWFEETHTEHGRQLRERDQMEAEELWQQIHSAEVASLVLEGLEEQEGSVEDEVQSAREILRAALNRSSRAIMVLGHSHISGKLRSIARAFKKDQYAMQIKIANERSEDYQAQIKRMNKVFDDGDQVIGAMSLQRELFVDEESRAFFNSSYLHTHLAPSKTTQDVDHEQFKKLVSDLDTHTAFVSSVELHALQVQLALSAAIEYKSKLDCMIAQFVDAYSPRLSTIADDTTIQMTPQLSGNIKDFCQFNSDEPGATWSSLVAMRDYVEKEVRLDRELQRLRESWKARFANTLLELHLDRWWGVAQLHLEHARDRLQEVRSLITKSLEQHRASERHFQAAVLDRASANRRMALLQRQLVETRQRQNSMLQILRTLRHSYDTAAAVMNDKLSSVKSDVSYKRWSSISEYHVGLVGELFDARSECSGQIDTFESEIKQCQDKLKSSDSIVASKHQDWLSESVNDTMICTKADALQSLAHRTLELVLSLEKQRVFHHFRVLDSRGFWLTDSTLNSWYEAKQKEVLRDKDARKATATQRQPGQDCVDDLLVQLSIARLDVIKQEKWRDTLQRKLVVFEQILHQQIELRQAVVSEAQSYCQLADQLARRVRYLRDQYNACSDSEFLRIGIELQQNQASSIDQRGATLAIRDSLRQLQELIASSQQDYLATEAKSCQLAWRIQEHTACEHRARRAIDAVKDQLGQVDGYLTVLKAKERELYELSLASEVSNLAASGTSSRRVADPMGMNVDVGRAVFEYYARDQWFRDCLSHTTALGEKAKGLREILLSMKSPARSSRLDSGVSGDAASSSLQRDTEITEGEDEQRVVVMRELQTIELALLLNRFESRRAEKTSEELRGTLSNSTTNNGQALGVLGMAFSGEQAREVDTVLPHKTLRSRMFSHEICVTERRLAQTLLRELATAFDPRDVAGNLSEVIFGASLDRNDLKGIFLLQSRAHVEEQWGAALVVLFFARLFRRASLKKAASLRRSQASIAMKEKLREIDEHQQLANEILRQSHSLCLQTPPFEGFRYPRGRELFELVNVLAEDDNARAFMSRVALGILLDQPLHRSLGLLMPDRAKPILELSDVMEERRAASEHQPPKPAQSRLHTRDKFSIKVEWKPATADRDLVYIAELCEHDQSCQDDQPKRRYWTQFLAVDRTNYTFHNLRPGCSYWIRVRTGFSRSRLGIPCYPILVATLDDRKS